MQSTTFCTMLMTKWRFSMSVNDAKRYMANLVDYLSLSEDPGWGFGCATYCIYLQESLSLTVAFSHCYWCTHTCTHSTDQVISTWPVRCVLWSVQCTSVPTYKQVFPCLKALSATSLPQDVSPHPTPIPNHPTNILVRDICCYTSTFWIYPLLISQEIGYNLNCMD